MDEYHALWEVSAEEAKTREGLLAVIKEILGARTPIVELNYGHGESMKTKLRERGLNLVTIRKYPQDLKRCSQHQVCLEVLPYNPLAEPSPSRPFFFLEESLFHFDRKEIAFLDGILLAPQETRQEQQQDFGEAATPLSRLQRADSSASGAGAEG
jgi:hypothetical protein